jgi:hypothetical protein
VPGYAEENSKVRMMCLKRYADFKALRASLLEVVEARRRQQARSSSGRGTGEMSRYSWLAPRLVRHQGARLEQYLTYAITFNDPIHQEDRSLSLS